MSLVMKHIHAFVVSYYENFLDKKDHTRYNNLACVRVVFLYTKNSARM